MSGKRGAKRTLRERPMRGKADFARLRGQAEADVDATSPPELAHLPDDFWDDAALVMPEPKEPISIRVDRDVLAWFRAQGTGYLTRMNAVLRLYMEARTGR